MKFAFNLIFALLVLASGCVSIGPAAQEPENENGNTTPRTASESWEIEGRWMYSPQAIWNDTFAGLEMVTGDMFSLEKQYISTYNLTSREKKRVAEFDPASARISPPAIYKNWVVWSQADVSGRLPSRIGWDSLNWDVYSLNLDNGEIKKITFEIHDQILPRIYGDTIVWLDNRNAAYDIYAFDLTTGQEKRITTSSSVQDDSLSISGNFVVWTDNRNAVWNKPTHGGNEPNYNNEIYACDLTQGTERRITNYSGNDHYPSIDGTRVVWHRQIAYGKGDVYSYDLAGNAANETQISHSDYAAFSPSVSGSVIVWADAAVSEGNTNNDVVVNGHTGGSDIYLYDLKQGKEMLLAPADAKDEELGRVLRRVLFNPVVSGSFVVYTYSRQIGSIVYATRLNWQ